MNYCKDCEYHRCVSQLDFCQHPNLGVDLVSGEVTMKMAFVSRNFYCGEEGNWFEPKQKLEERKKTWLEKLLSFVMRT